LKVNNLLEADGNRATSLVVIEGNPESKGEADVVFELIGIALNVTVWPRIACLTITVKTRQYSIAIFFIFAGLRSPNKILN